MSFIVGRIYRNYRVYEVCRVDRVQGGVRICRGITVLSRQPSPECLQLGFRIYGVAGLCSCRRVRQILPEVPVCMLLRKGCVGFTIGLCCLGLRMGAYGFGACPTGTLVEAYACK